MEIKDQKKRLSKVEEKKREEKNKSIEERRVRKFLNHQVRNNKENHETLRREN